MSLVRLYGRRSVVFTDDRNVYRSVNGVLDIPPALVTRAIENGFSKTVPADMREPDETVEPIAPVVTTAEQTIGLPTDHPQSTTDRVLEARQVERAAAAAAQETATQPKTARPARRPKP